MLQDVRVADAVRSGDRTGDDRRYLGRLVRANRSGLTSIVDAAPSNVGTHLKELESDGAHIPSSPHRAGRGFHYVWARESR